MPLFCGRLATTFAVATMQGAESVSSACAGYCERPAARGLHTAKVYSHTISLFVLRVHKGLVRRTIILLHQCSLIR